MTSTVAPSENTFVAKLQATEKVISHYFYAMFINRQGRIGRVQFIFALGMLMYLYLLSFDAGSSLIAHYYPHNNMAFSLFLIALALPFQRPLQALFAKRLHDINQSGWIFFIGIFLYYCSIPVFENSLLLIDLVKSGQIFNVGVLKDKLEFQHAFLLQVLLYNVFVIFILFFKKGTKGENNYGSDPLQAKHSGKRFAHIIEYKN